MVKAGFSVILPKNIQLWQVQEVLLANCENVKIQVEKVAHHFE